MSAPAFSGPGLDRMRTILDGYVHRCEIPGLVTGLRRRGHSEVSAVGWQAAAGAAPMRRDNIFRIASITKPIAAAAAMMLVEECRLRLDDSLDEYLPELADRRVLVQWDAPLEQTVPALRSITLRDLLTQRMGLGHILMACQDFPIRRELDRLQLLLGPPHPRALPAADEWLRRVGSLPLLVQPGEEFLYDLAFDVLGVLLERVAGEPLELFLQTRLFEPLEMRDTGFWVPPAKLERLVPCYEPDAATGELRLYDSVPESEWARPPAMASAAGGLVSTVDDLLNFGTMLLQGGRFNGRRVLSRAAVELMFTNQLTEAQRRRAALLLGEHRGWGLGAAVTLTRNQMYATPGSYGWDGGLGTSWAVDPGEGIVGVLLTQCAWTSPAPPPVWKDFWTASYGALAD